MRTEIGIETRMRIIFILVALLVYPFFHASAQQLSRTIQLSPGLRTVPGILHEIDAIEGINLSYATSILPGSTIDVDGEPRTLMGYLNLLFDKGGYSFIEKNNVVLILRSKQAQTATSPQTFTISGIVSGKKNGELLVGANIWVDSLNTGVSTNAYGFYSLTLPKGSYQLRISYLGFEPMKSQVLIDRNLKYNFKMEESISELNEVIVSPEGRPMLLYETHPGKHKMDLKTFGKIPYFLGEVDVQQGALTLPGITNLGEDAIGLNVRGGSTDQNLMLLDEAVVYNTSHFFGLVSIFHPDAVKDVEIFKGSIPTAYGGRASSVIHVRKREGNYNKFGVAGGLGLATGRLLVEGPIKKDKISFLLAGRVSYTSLLFDILNESRLQSSTANFHDINAKISFNFNENNRLYISAYTGRDSNRTGTDLLRKWGNNTATVRWNHTFSPKLFMNYSAVFSDYEYQTGDPQLVGQVVGTSQIRNYTTKGDFTWFPNPSNTVSFGGGVTFHRLNPGDRLPNDEQAVENPIILDSEHGIEPYIYIDNEQKLGSRLKLFYGLRFSALLNMGPGDVFLYEADQPRERETIVDTLSYDKYEVIDYFLGLEPRLALNYTLSPRSSVKLSYNRTVQYLHLISNTSSPAPTDVWTLSGPYIEPQIGNQVTGGYFRTLAKDKLEFSVELFYRFMDNILEYKDGAELLLNETIETELRSGIGRAYGAEFYLKGNFDRFTGWMSYTLSRTERKVDGATNPEKINQGNWFPTDYDKTHNFSMTGIYRLNERWSLSGNFIFQTGRPLTFPDAKYQFENIIVPNFPDRNQDRISSYHRLDIAATLSGKTYKFKRGKETKRKMEDQWVFSIYNVYARQNAFSYFFRQDPMNPGQTEIVKYSILGTIIPSVTYNFRF